MRKLKSRFSKIKRKNLKRKLLLAFRKGLEFKGESIAKVHGII